MRTRAAHRDWLDAGSPGSRPRSFCTCQVLRPRRVDQALAMMRLFVLPSALETASAPGFKVSRLNGWPMPSPTDASSPSSRTPNARLGADVDRYSFIVVDLHHLLLAGLPAHFESYMPRLAVRLLLRDERLGDGLPAGGKSHVALFEIDQRQRVASAPRPRPLKGAPNVVGTPVMVGIPVWVVAHVGVLGAVDADGVEGGVMPLSGGSKLITGAERFGFRATDGGLRPPPPTSVEPSGIPAGPTVDPGPMDEAKGGD